MAVARDERLLRARCACPAKWIEVSPLRRPRVGPGDGRPPEAWEAQASSTKSVGSELLAGRPPGGSGERRVLVVVNRAGPGPPSHLPST